MVVNLTAFEVFFQKEEFFFKKGRIYLILALELLADEDNAL